MLKLLSLAILVSLVLLGLIIITEAFALLVSLVVSCLLSTYLLVELRKQRKKEKEKKNEETNHKHNNNSSGNWSSHTHGIHIRIPFIVFFGLMLVPIVVASFYASEGFNSASFYSIVVAFGMTLTFIDGLVNVPLSIYHKKLERKISLPLLKPLVTILVPAYNEQRTIERTLVSIIEADYPNKEIIVIDDGSTDSTYSIVAKYAKKMSSSSSSSSSSLARRMTTSTTSFFSVIRKENGGKSSAINYGLRFARGEFVIVVDADCIVARDAIKELIKYFQFPYVVAVGGNIKVVNRMNILTWCQALEYLSGINLVKRAYDIFGVVMIVPGALGGFQKSVLVGSGKYDKDTLTEDFDVTLKVLKTGKAVQASSYAISFTEAPTTLKSFYRQRLRWYRGNVQTLIKHRDVITNSRYRMLHKYGYPLVIFTLLMLPFLGIAVSVFTILALIHGQWFFILVTFLIFTILEFFLSAIAVTIDDEDWKLVLYSPLFVIGYKQLLDFVIVKSILDVVLFRKNFKWTSAKETTTIPRQV